MKYQAVIFDLFGTLVGNLYGPQYNDILRRIALILSVPSKDFLRMWSATTYARNTGAFRSVEVNIIHICQELGSQPKGDVKSAAQIRQDYARHIMMKPRPDAVSVISQLKSLGYKAGLISNCTTDAPAIWPDTPFAHLFDVAVFSCSAGLMKPDPRIYQIAVEQLAVEPNECLYIADGIDQELAGAAQVGMHPVQIYVTGEDSIDSHREEWDGPVISSLTEVLALVR